VGALFQAIGFGVQLGCQTKQLIGNLGRHVRQSPQFLSRISQKSYLLLHNAYENAIPKIAVSPLTQNYAP
jgi:hypothetical protein